MGATKIGVIGAGSAQFSLGLIKDMCLEERLADSEVVFMDLDNERLEVMHRLATRYAEELGARISFTRTTDRSEALEDVSFVVNMAAPSHDDDEADRILGESHGYYRGTRLNAHRNLELMLSIARDIETLAPDAWLIQSSNPVFDGCTLVTRETSVKTIGLCHGHYGYQRIARTLGIDPDEVRCEAIGVNHCIWATNMTYRGESLYPMIDRWIENDAEEYWATYEPDYNDFQMSRAAIDQYRFLGLMGIGGTVRHTGWQYHLDLEEKQRWFGPLGGFDSELGWAGYLADLEIAIDKIFQAAMDPDVSLVEAFPPERTREQQVPIINSIVNDVPEVYQVNVPNRGAIPGIDGDVVVELPATISSWGVRPHQSPALPKRLMLHVIDPKILEMERHVEAVRSGDRAMLMSSLLWDPRTRTQEQASAYLDALLAQPHNESMRTALK